MWIKAYFASKKSIFGQAYLLAGCFRFEGLGDTCLQFGRHFPDSTVLLLPIPN